MTDRQGDLLRTSRKDAEIGGNLEVGPHSKPVFVRYWGSHIKKPHDIEKLVTEFNPMIGRGWQCRLVLEPTQTAYPLTALEEKGIKIDYFQRPTRTYDVRAFLRAFRYFRRIRATIVSCDNIHMIPLAAAFVAGVPVRLWRKRAMNSHYEEVREPNFKERLALNTRLSCSLATRVTTVSEAVRNELIGMGVPDRKVLVRRNSIPNFGAATKTRDEVRTALGFGSNEIVVITVGHAVPVKGWDILVSAFSVLAANFPKTQLLLVGSYQKKEEQPFYDKLKRTIAASRLENRIKFTGHVPDVRNVLQAGDIYVHPSRSEGFSNALIEALHLGLPCVSSRVGDAEFLIRNGVNGILVERCNPEELEKALAKLAESDQLRREFAAFATLPPGMTTLEEYSLRVVEDIRHASSGLEL